MAGATIPDVQGATYPEQARPQQIDWDSVVAGFNKTGVLSGCAASAGGGMNVAIAAGQIILTGSAVVSIGAQNVGVVVDPGGHDRYAWILADINGALSVAYGAWDAAKAVPEKPTGAQLAGKVSLAEVFIPIGAANVALAMITDKRMVLNNPQNLEALSQILVVGHSLMAEGGASKLDAGSMHKFANLFPARFVNLAVGGSVGMIPGVWNPDTQAGVGTVLAGWGWVTSQLPNRERNTGLNTTLGATIGPGYAAGTSTLVGSSAGWTPSQPVMVGRGATAEMTYIAGSLDGTHVSFIDALVNQHLSGEPVVAVPDAWLMNRQTVCVEYEWNDLAWAGPTSWGQAFIHNYRAIIAWLRCMAYFPADSVLVRGSTTPGGAWTQVATAAGFAPGNKYMTHANVGATITNDIPVNLPAGSQVPLFFMTNPAGDGAQWTITIDGDAAHAVTYDTRNINGYAYAAGAGTRAANGTWMMSCYVVRGLSAGAHTIVLSQAAAQNAAYFAGFGIIPPDVGPMFVERPNRLYNYSGFYTSPLYTPSDADQATMDTAIMNLCAEFTNPVSTVFGGTAAPDVTLFTVAKDSVINKQKKWFYSDGVHYNDGGHAEVANLMVQAVNNVAVPLRSLIIPTPTDGGGIYPVVASTSPLTVASYAKFATGWQNYAGERPAGYKKDIPSKWVQMFGLIQCTSATLLNPTILTMPVGHRPLFEQHFVIATINGPLQVALEPDGTLKVLGFQPGQTIASWVSLSQIWFMAEQ